MIMILGMAVSCSAGQASSFYEMLTVKFEGMDAVELEKYLKAVKEVSVNEEAYAKTSSFGFGDALLAEFAALAFRFDYACFFNGKVGITACITDGLGYGMVGNSPGFMNAFSIKLGPIFKL